MRANTPAAPRRPFLSARDAAPALFALALIVATALQSCASGGARYAEPDRAVNEPVLRIRVAREESLAEFNAVSKIEVAATHGSRSVVLAPPLRITLAEAGWTVVPQGAGAGEAGAQVFDRADGLTLRATGAAAIAFRGASYPGHMTLHTREDLSLGAFDVVEHVPMEMYLSGVVAKEMYAKWSAAAYEAQAIAARTYALHERDRRRAKGEYSDLDNTDADQVYTGLSANGAAADACRATRGAVLTTNGALLRAYYSSTCGGRAASAKDIWPTTRGFEFNLAGPIQGRDREHACQFSPLYRWSVTRDATDAGKRVAAWGAEQKLSVRNIKRITRIEVIRTNETGRACEYRLTDSAGKTYAISAEHCRTALNYSRAPGLAPIVRETRVHAADFEATVSGSGAGAKITFAGRGFGHGVGMCQFCAEGFARRGDDAHTMLLRFYPGAAITRAY